jgi:hypothetical protein
MTPLHPPLETLSDDLDGALSWPQRVRLARHLSRCPACAARRAELSALAEAARNRFADAAVPAPLVAAVAAALPGRSRPYGALRLALTAGVAAATVGLGTVVLLPILRPTPAFAQVVLAMNGARTVQWELISEHGTVDADGWHEHSQRDRNRYRIDLVRSLRREEFGREAYSIDTPDTHLIVNGKWARREYRTAEPLQEDYRREWEAIGKLLDGALPKGIARRSEEIVDGVRCIRFDLSVPTRPTEPPGTVHSGQIWVDPVTRRVIRDRSETRSKATFEIHTRQNFRYDDPIPAEAFSLALPPGVRWAHGLPARAVYSSSR